MRKSVREIEKNDSCARARPATFENATIIKIATTIYLGFCNPLLLAHFSMFSRTFS
jgi:hypothetical protein